jgi:hypothetical protein
MDCTTSLAAAKLSCAVGASATAIADNSDSRTLTTSASGTCTVAKRQRETARRISRTPRRRRTHSR